MAKTYFYLPLAHFLQNLKPNTLFYLAYSLTSIGFKRPCQKPNELKPTKLFVDNKPKRK